MDDIMRKCCIKPGHVMELVKMFETYESHRWTAEPGKTFRRRRPTRIVFAGERTPPKRGPCTCNRGLGTPPAGTVKVVPGPSAESSAVSVGTQTVYRSHSGARGDVAKRPSVSTRLPIVDEIQYHGIVYAPEFNRGGKGGRVRDDALYGPDRSVGFGGTGTWENVRNEPRFALRIGYPVKTSERRATTLAKTSERRATTLANQSRNVPEYLRPGFVKRLIERFENGVCLINVF